ncbi:UDP-N-acetylmuramoyl-L-alanyl-D-glutamate--2,6-diaminopimelate ligase [Virgibacillus sp. NKC19-16]|uniref:UDP-N-acetylmuramoyl-L-alanyl-D-glutamate--2, 6-diaminopimelate ligase n=1 Tax=Virgibacillus salidurans TaxID=2831673 RepID=UPI001F227046|nr:UDP-N-acetylmuramoyl-L-alanyl-D-glutamate--2,6-diaminopimelate ligase [Virgibacillus sp. NKC19-16]UJL47850.1 UDP-N-acetylmuramoyl-L-alanyl-D-glutamate--2,6-diaminopimelate ligase [Virgibacillus sp. NKC19-16]
MKLTEMLSSIPFYETASFIEEIDIHDIEIDSRKVKPGSLFVCINGFTVDGHNYVKQAIDNGAVVIITEKKVTSSVPIVTVSDTIRTLAILAVKFYNNPTSKIPLIGVTGTNGKTTVTYLLETIFQHNKKKTGVIGTIQMKIGEKTYPIDNTTPNSLLLQKSFQKMLDQNVEQAIMEVSSHALDIGRVYGCDYDVAVFTNLSQDHLDYHKNIDDYLRAKSLLFAQLGNTYSEGDPKFAVINEDDPSSTYMKQSTAQHVITYGCQNDAKVMAKDIKLDAKGTFFRLKTPVGTVSINSNLIGMFNIYNMLAASTAAIAWNVPLHVIKHALESILGVDGRFEPVTTDQSYAVIVDYAHTPDSLENVLQTAKGFAQKKVYVVVGCGGNRDRAKRPLMAGIALNYADHVIFTSDNPRSEDPRVILNDMTAGLEKSRQKYEVIIDRKKAIYQAIEHAQDEDIILIAGKGHETYQEVGSVKYNFDDRKVAKEAIQAKEK